MAKQTLYEILGTTADATGHDIQRAFEDRRQALCEKFEGEDRRNQLSFLDHAREVLSDPRRRAAYDKSNLVQPADLEPAPTNPRKGRVAVIGLIVIVAGMLLWRQFPPKAERVAPGTPAREIAIKAPALPGVTHELPSIEDAATALMPPDRAADPAPSAKAAAPPAATAPPPVVRVVVQGDPLMSKILESTYAIVGAQGFGTGVAIEAERLLTNCHVIAPNVLKGKIYAVRPATGARVEITEAAFLVKEDACVVFAPGLGAQPMALGDTSRLQRGARLHNIGFGGGKLTLAQGLYIGSLVRFGQSYMLSTNACVPGVSGGPLVDDEGRLIGLTSGGARDSNGNNVCASLTVETARAVLSERMMQIDAFPTNYRTNWTGRR